MNEIIKTEIPTSDYLKPIVAEVLRNEANTGCANFAANALNIPVPSKTACIALQSENDWNPAIRSIYEIKEEWISSLNNHLSQLPTDFFRSPEYQEQLARSKGPKIIRFYNSLWSLMSIALGEEQMEAAFNDHQAHHAVNRSFAEIALSTVNFNNISQYLRIPNTPYDQLNLVISLGPQIFKDWHLP